MEGRPTVCYSNGAIDSLVDKLNKAMNSYPMVGPLLRDLESLRANLVNKFARGRATHNQVREWMKQIRELVYNIEDWIDLKLATKLVESETELQQQIDRFKAKIEAACARNERYNLLGKAAISDAEHSDATPSEKVAVDYQLLLEEKAVLVGIDGPRENLEMHLKDTHKKRKVVSVQGMGGIGKTTLATKVYEELHRQFECHASVTVGRNSSTTALMDVFLQVNPAMDTRSSLNDQELIHKLWEYLQNKRYFIFIDDIRNTHAWNVINCALPNNGLRSLILTTTRVKDVAMLCSLRPTDAVYEMKGLDNGDSKLLLLTTIYAKTEHRSENIEKVCDDMLHKCCGLPLAIIVTAGLLAMKDAAPGSLGTPEEPDGMRNVLDIAFTDLALPLKACFLYLSAFPENYTIKKQRLVRRWIAERFIPKTGQKSLWETGESYFNELICRKLIRPVFEDYDDQVVACTVPSVIHEFIASLSRQEEFLTTAAELISGPFPCHTVRRFSVHCSRQERDEADILISSAVHLSRMRSLTVSGYAGRVPDLSAFKHLWVLDLEDTKTVDDHQLESIGLLFLLRYLGLGGTNVTKLPEKVMELKQLSTLDLRRTSVMELQAVGGTELVCVLADGLIIPREIGEMTQLEELSTVSLQPDDAAGLVNKSMKLRMLGVTFGYVYIPTKTNRQGIKRLLEEVEKSKLHSFFLDDYPCDSVGLLVKHWANKRPHHLKKFELRMSDYLRVVPQKMASLIALTHLHIRVRELEAHVICALGKLPNLVLLNLFSRRGTQGRLTIGSKDGFGFLKVFCFSCSIFLGMGLQFEEGSMPQLRRLRIDISPKETKSAYSDFDFGIQHLYSLVHVHAIIRCKHATVSEAEEAVAAIRNQVSQIKESDNSSTPSVDIRISILPEPSLHKSIPGSMSFVMEDAMVSVSTGAMNSILTKIAILMGERYVELTDTDERDQALRDEIQVMDALLKQLSAMPDLNIQMKECRNQMRELTYDIEDSLDDLTVCSISEKGTESTVEKWVMPHDSIVQIQKLNAQVVADLESMVCKAEKRTFESVHMAREHWLPKVYDEGNRLVGVDASRDEIVKQLMDERQDTLQVVCIFGAAGIGKTALATQVYNEVRRRFRRGAFVSAYLETDFNDDVCVRMQRLRRSILQQLKVYVSLADLEQAAIEIKEKLCDTRFLIVIDGVSSAQILEDVKFVLPQNSRGSRIIITTHMNGVAEYCREHFSSFIYAMKPLMCQDSLRLFRRIILGPGKRSCPSELKEVHEQIIVEACQGMPLAITLIAGLLASKPAETAHWSAVEEHLKSVKGNHLTEEWLRDIFVIGYSDLSRDMKTCLLYLSIFPANHVMRKDRLIRRWAAEGFLPERRAETWWQTGESYFLELIARKLIQPVYNDPGFGFLYTNDDVVLPMGCRVGGSIHDFIRSLSSEENFVKPGMHGAFWRLSDSGPCYKELEALFKEHQISKVRSLTFEGKVSYTRMPYLSAFKHVRVLDLEDNNRLLEENLCSLGRLSLLRYLGLAGTDFKSLPQEIIALEHLETVDLRRNTLMRELPAFRSTKLVSLIADRITLPKGMEETQRVLEELSTVLVGDDGDRLANVVNQSKRMRRLGIIIGTEAVSKHGRKGLMGLLGEIGNSNIQSLCLDDGWSGSVLFDILQDCWAQHRPPHLQTLELRIHLGLPEVPRNISPSLIYLTHLSIRAEKVDTEGFHILGDLPNLVFLSLKTQHMTQRSLIGKNGFRCLRVFWFICQYNGGMGLQFEAGVMPQLQRLWLEFDVKQTESEFGRADFGIQFLACLVQVHATINCGKSTAASVEAVEAAMRSQVCQNPNNPMLEITRGGDMVRNTVTGIQRTSKSRDCQEKTNTPGGDHMVQDTVRRIPRTRKNKGRLS
ncbi:hypothetical protein EJB05_27212, partial [Eragrostis curvula]